MQLLKILKTSIKHSLSPSRLINLILIPSSLYILYLLLSLLLNNHHPRLDLYSGDPAASTSPPPPPPPLSLDHLVFGIASNKNSFPRRRHYIAQWWRPGLTRGFVFLDAPVPSSSGGNDTRLLPLLPPIRISEDTSGFSYTNRNGLRSAIRVARVVVETVAMNLTDVRWFVFGDDDTVFFPDNLVKTLSKYDDGLWYYVGSNSEVYEQNRVFSFGMGFGGAGFAISRPLAKVLAKGLDGCMERYAQAYGSDSRVYACLTELGVGLTREPGFHQFDVRGDAFGLLAAHPLAPLSSLHHIDHTDPIFPNMTRPEAMQHLFRAAQIDSQRLLQQSVCYDTSSSWTVSVSWGYAVQVFPRHLLMTEAVRVRETFSQWKKGSVLARSYGFNTREVEPDPCERPTVFFMSGVASRKDWIKSAYKKHDDGDCLSDMASPRKIEEVRVYSRKLDLDIKQLQAPRRHCCDVLPSSIGKVMEIAIRECGEEESIFMRQ
ncbi:uncharacterized protein LOC115750825 [Rhodamnia argentea]|uniref:Uncharacterized protein LOC115750825 n=1 Tax=Rhodamnia argentea TaxID=178133 RepID=A0A8B8QAX5_9MYRT|nr:uncharacterized protein LOC115750825 [Rhodamnia argentea]